MSELTQEEKRTFDVSTCDPQVYLEIVDNLDYYQRQGNPKAINVFLELKNQMEQRCDMQSIKRSLNGHLGEPKIPTPKRFTYRNFDLFEIDKNGKLTFIPPKQETPKIEEPIPEALLALRSLIAPNYEEEHRKTLFPETCTPACPHRTCGYYRQENFGKPCQMRLEQYKTPPSQLETRTLDPNEPDYRSPQFREEETKKPKTKELKESLNPM